MITQVYAAAWLLIYRNMAVAPSVIPMHRGPGHQKGN